MSMDGRHDVPRWDAEEILTTDPLAMIARAAAVGDAAAQEVLRLDALIEARDAEGAGASLTNLSSWLDLTLQAEIAITLGRIVAGDSAELTAGEQTVKAAVRQTRQLQEAWERIWRDLGPDQLDWLTQTAAGQAIFHRLRRAAPRQQQVLPPGERRVLEQRDVTSRAGWVALSAQLQSRLRIDLGEHVISLDHALAALKGPDRAERQRTSEALGQALQAQDDLFAHGYSMVVLDHAGTDRLLGRRHWLAAINEANELSDASVAALLTAVEDRYPLAQQWWRRKAELLQIPDFAHFDRMAPVQAPEDGRTFTFAEAREIVVGAYADIAPECGDAARLHFDQPWIDAVARPRKPQGAFCSAGAPSGHPYVSVLFEGTTRDLLDLAHEVGHGVHAVLAGPQGALQHLPGPALAEVASGVGEAVVLERLVAEANTPQAMTALLGDRIDIAVANTFRQVATLGFEAAVHEMVGANGPASAGAIAEHWTRCQQDMHGDTVSAGPGYEHWWAFVPHITRSPGYVYAYAASELLALSLLERRDADGESFAANYLQLLQAGGSRSPAELLSPFGVDVEDPEFWELGLARLERLVSMV